jgi:hypothetical protein
MQKHNVPAKTHIPAKKLGRHHINDDVSNAPAIGNPNSSNFFVSEKFGKNGKIIPIKPPIPVKQSRFSIPCKLALVDNLPVKVKQTPNRAPISESLSAVDPTTGASRPISM